MNTCKSCKWWARERQWNDDGKLPEFCAPCKEPNIGHLFLKQWAMFNDFTGNGFMYPMAHTGENGTCSAFNTCEEAKK